MAYLRQQSYFIKVRTCIDMHEQAKIQGQYKLSWNLSHENAMFQIAT